MRLLRHRDETPVRVRALTASAGFGPGTTFRFGEVFDVPAWRAKELIAAGSAELAPGGAEVGTPVSGQRCVVSGRPILSHRGRGS
jgi:hypothetical protein